MEHRSLLWLAALTLAGTAVLPFAAGASGDGTPPPRKLLVRAGRIYTGAPEGAKVPAFLSPGALLVVDGKVVEVASSLEKPADAVLLDLGDAVVMPGIVDASTTLAGTTPFFFPGQVVWKDDAISAHFDPADAFDPFADWRATLLGGVTTVYLGCGNDRLISGQGAVAKLATREGAAAILARRTQLEINLGPASLRPPNRIDPPIPPSADHPIVPSEVQLPTTRLGQLVGVREAFKRAQKGPTGDLPLSVLAEAVNARRTLRICADEAPDLLRAVQAARELGHPAVICGAAEGALVADQLAAARYPVIVEIGLQLESPPGERAVTPDAPHLRLETAAELVRRGVKVALATPVRRDPADILLAGAIALRGGLTTEQAVAALTRVPAEILGVGHRLGCLMPGKDADFIVLSGEPFLRSSHVQRVYVEGRLAAERTETAAALPSVVIRAGTVLTGVGEPIRNGAIAIRDGRIVGVGSDVSAPPNARIIDAGPGAVITPGFLDCNSHLELGEDRTNLSLDLDLALLVAQAGDDALLVARGGVTTALIQPWQAHPSGSRVMAVKTAGATRKERLVDALAAVKHYWRGPVDPIATAERIRNELRRGKEYTDKWLKYAEEQKKWDEEQKKKTPDALAAEKAKAEADKKKAGEAPGDAAKDKKVDPITGKWEVSVSGGPLPEAQTGMMRLKLEGDHVTGQFGALFGDEEDPRALSGTFTDKHLSLEVDIDIPIGKPRIEADLDAEDHLKGRLQIGTQFNLDLEAKRTEKEYVEIAVAKTKKKGPEGKPTAPDVQPELEPYRRVFAGEVPILLDCDTAIGIRHALKLFAEFKVEVVLLGADELTRLPPSEWKGVVKGVVLPESIELTRNRLPFVPAVELSALGVPLGFQSNGINAARGLAMNVAYAVRQGMDPRAALRALTIEPARFFHLDDQVGSLETGKQGDLLVFSGDPFELSTRLLRVFVNGKELDLEDKP